MEIDYNKSAGQVQRLYTEHPFGMKRKSEHTGNCVRTSDNKALLISSQAPTPAALGENEWRCENLPNSGNPKLQCTDMPAVGDVRKACDIGYHGHALYTYSICSSCGKERWVRLHDVEQGKSLVCRSCGYQSSNTHQNKQSSLLEAGAKRASEIGKPVFKSRDPWYYPRVCKSCGKDIWQQSKDFHRVCKECAYEIRKTRSGKSHPNWNGGKYTHGDGYIVVRVLSNSPFLDMADSKGYCLEHRLVMATYIGRCLLAEEVVHHINGDKKDNSIENLELLPDNVAHMPYNLLQRQINELRKKVQEQQDHIKLLEWHVRELEHGNPELAGSEELLGKCRDFTGGAPCNRTGKSSKEQRESPYSGEILR